LREDTRHAIEKKQVQGTFYSPKHAPTEAKTILEPGMERIPSMVKVNTQGINKKILF
jgi:hypothetical protein